MVKHAVIVLLVMAVLLPVAAKAEDQGSIELTSVSEIEVVVRNDSGEEETRRVDAATEKIVPGDVVIFTTSFVHIGKEPVDDVVITNPLPDHMVYVEGSADGKGTVISFSVDGGKTYGDPGTLRVIENGTTRQARPDDYTHIQWVLRSSLKPGGTGSVTFRAKVK